MRVSLVGPSHPYRGGIAAHTTELAHRLAAAGHDTVIESWAAQYPAFLYPGDSQVTDVPEGPRFEPLRSTLAWNRPDTWWRVGRRLADRELVVLTVVTPVQAVPYRVLLGALDRRVRTVALCHNVLPHERRAVDEVLTRSVLRRVGAVLVHTEPQAAQARALTQRPVRVATMAPHLLAGTAAAAAPGAAAAGGEPTEAYRRLLFFGMVRPYKGLDLLLRALAAGPADVSLLVAGEFWGGVEPTQQLVDELGLAGRVTLAPGYVPAAAVPGLFAGVDALVLPYRTATASQNAWVAFEHGVPVITTRAGSLGEQVCDGVDGVLAEPDDVADLTAALHRFYAPGTPEKLRAGVKALDAEPLWQRYLATLLDTG
jgi:glycosyltransferase involved in cell wall biosynthesis